MCKILIDAFDTEEDAVLFILWLEKSLNKGVTLHGVAKETEIVFDGVDTDGSTPSCKVVNIVSYEND